MFLDFLLRGRNCVNGTIIRLPSQLRNSCEYNTLQPHGSFMLDGLPVATVRINLGLGSADYLPIDLVDPCSLVSLWLGFHTDINAIMIVQKMGENISCKTVELCTTVVYSYAHQS